MLCGEASAARVLKSAVWVDEFTQDLDVAIVDVEDGMCCVVVLHERNNKECRIKNTLSELERNVIGVDLVGWVCDL